MYTVWKSAVGAAVLAMSITAADAATVNVSGAGFFGMDTAPTTESQPGQTFSFSFITENPIAGNPDTALTNPVFTLSGFAIQPTIVSVNFGDKASGGLFDLLFSDNNVLSFYGADIVDSGLLQPGAYSADVALRGGSPTGVGLVAVSVNVSPVPLPSSAPMFGAALFGLGALGYAFKYKTRTRAQI